MTRIFYDTEFLEDGNTIELISIGMVTDSGDEYYAVNLDMPMERIAKHRWLMDNVVPGLPAPAGGDAARAHGLLVDPDHPTVKRKNRIAYEVREFILAQPSPQLWAWYGAYDHVVLAQLWGSMTSLPDGVPMWTNDLRQEEARLGDPHIPDPPETGRHNALWDARYNKVRAWYLRNFEWEGAYDRVVDRWKGFVHGDDLHPADVFPAAVTDAALGRNT